jgi:hypothetical protein
VINALRGLNSGDLHAYRHDVVAFVSQLPSLGGKPSAATATSSNGAPAATKGYPWREKLAKFKGELGKGVWGYWELGAWRHSASAPASAPASARRSSSPARNGPTTRPAGRCGPSAKATSATASPPRSKRAISSLSVHSFACSTGCCVDDA